MPSTNRLTPFLMIASIFAASFAIQALLFLNWDVASLLSATQVLLAGGKYVTDIFTPNPPMILYLYIPPVLISKYLSLDLVGVFRVYIYLTSILSLLACYQCISKYFKDKSINITHIFIYTLAFSYLVLPIYEFGNRDHLLLILTMPYLLTVVLRLEKIPVSSLFALVIGFAAGVGFAIKPQFLATLGLVEIYYLYKNRKWLANFRIETMMIAAILVVYGITTWALHTGFVEVIIPFLLRNYYSTISESFYTLSVYPLTIFCFMALLLCFTHFFNKQLSSLLPILGLALIGFLISIYAQRTLFYYHFIPAIAVSLLITSMILVTYLASNSKRANASMGLLAVLFVVCDIFLYPHSWYNIIFYPGYFYAFFTLLFLSLFFISNQNSLISVMTRVAFIVLSGLGLGYLLVDFGLFNHQFAFVVGLMAVLYVLLAGLQDADLRKQAILVTLAIALLYAPAMKGYSLFLGPREFKTGPLKVMTAFINSQGRKQSVYSFSPAIYFTFPAVFYANANSGQRFDQLWPIIGFAKHTQSLPSKDRAYFTKMVAEDLRTNKPDLIFIDIVNVNPKALNYVTFFSENAEFRQEWKSYRYLTSINLGKINSINAIIPVYQRIKE